ncbi:hypothetical protein BU23DRAFT_603515 [Bimuria novae-zelandiae CBS 107.79]|uniref:NACHT-NTPase and P-loop NTPases N-terminal domain-containing protein n=1 Tax=Bimuria novae-zelandiae CBS 107.79 TaxID=1447943 RepID=A0A6A5UNI1_9PLEO|nr:hypothetical protein BU23DRAFT_603515 [Bimuria novae-zelandiae CBS 107.79]
MLVADNLSLLNDKIKAFARPDLLVSGSLAAENQALENLAGKLGQVADELTLVLHWVRLKGDVTMFKSFTQAILTMWNKSRIDETMQLLESIREAVPFHLVVSMVGKVDRIQVKADASLQSLDNVTKVIVDSILQGQTDLAAMISAQTLRSIEREDARDATATQRHNEVSAKLDQLTQHTDVDLGNTSTTKEERQRIILYHI